MELEKVVRELRAELEAIKTERTRAMEMRRAWEDRRARADSESHAMVVALLGELESGRADACRRAQEAEDRVLQLNRELTEVEASRDRWASMSFLGRNLDGKSITQWRDKTREYGAKLATLRRDPAVPKACENCRHACDPSGCEACGGDPMGGQDVLCVRCDTQCDLKLEERTEVVAYLRRQAELQGAQGAMLLWKLAGEIEAERHVEGQS